MKDSDLSAGSETCVSPSLKKLKQARLPFQVITPDASASESPVSKKRKLSDSHDESRLKIGKISEHKENDAQSKVDFNESVVISDDEAIADNNSNSEGNPESKILNPLLSLVDVALKRKLRKRTSPKTPKVAKISAKSKRTRSSVGAKKSAVTSERVEVSECINNKENADVIQIDDDEVQMVDESDSIEKNCVDEVDRDLLSDEPSEKSEEIVENLNEDKDGSDLGGEIPDIASVQTPSRKRSLRKVEFVTPKSANKDSGSGNDTDRSAGSPLSASADLKKLTPKQLQKKLESIKKQQEREKEKLEKEQKRQEEKEEKNKQKLEKEEQKKREREEKERFKEEERKQKELKEEEKRKEKEEKELQKKREKEAKEEEKRKREDEKEEEKRQKEDEKRHKELEQENKKKKAAAAFANFFVPKEKPGAPKETTVNQSPDAVLKKNEHLSNFRIKPCMRLAPTTRDQLSSERKSSLDVFLSNQKTDLKKLYIQGLKNKEYAVKTSNKTWPLADLNDVEIIEDDLLPVDENNIIMEDSHANHNLKPKLLSFTENRRPAYWGTWRRKSKHIRGRRPFGMDQIHLDYSCDSDEEWEEEEPGESVGGSVAGSDAEDGEDEYVVDNEFMVPHGYLSEEEATLREDQDDKVFSPESQLAKLKSLESEFENERKKATERLHPRLIGIIWQNSEGGKPDTCVEAIWNFLNLRKALSEESQVLIKPSFDNTESELDDTLKNINEKSAKKHRKITEEMIPDLIRLIHGNINSRGFLANEFQIFISKRSSDAVTNTEDEEDKVILQNEISKISIARKIKEISKWRSCPEDGAMLAKTCWFVEKDVREKYNIAELELPNTWTYSLTPKRRDLKRVKRSTPREKVNTDQSKHVTKEASAKKDNAFNITKFTKQLTQEEREKQFISNNVPSPALLVNGNENTSNPKGENDKNANGTTPAQVSAEKKRVPLLFSGPRGKSLPSSQGNTDESKTKRIENKSPTGLQTKNQTNQPDPAAATKIESSEKKSANKGEVKKRVSLVSMPKSQNVSKVIKTNLLTQFIKSVPVAKKDKVGAKTDINSDRNILPKASPVEVDDDCVVLSD